MGILPGLKRETISLTITTGQSYRAAVFFRAEMRLPISLQRTVSSLTSEFLRLARRAWGVGMVAPLDGAVVSLAGTFVRNSAFKRAEIESMTINPVSGGGNPAGGREMRASRCDSDGGWKCFSRPSKVDTSVSGAFGTASVDEVVVFRISSNLDRFAGPAVSVGY